MSLVSSGHCKLVSWDVFWLLPALGDTFTETVLLPLTAKSCLSDFDCAFCLLGTGTFLY